MSPRLDIRLLGPPDLRLGGAPVPFRYDKLRALLAYLAVEASRPHPRDALAGLLWPDVPDRDARRNLNQALFNLRQALDEAKAAIPYLVSSRDTLQFNSTSSYTLDIEVFQGLLAACRAHAHPSLAGCAECGERLRAAMDLYRGDFLHQFFLESSTGFEEWVLLRRSDLHQQALAALADLVVWAEAQRDLPMAQHYAQRQIALEPWREEAHRELMRLLALTGARSTALAQFEACRKVLADELGVEPSPETVALYEQIKAGKLGAPPASQAAPSAPARLPTPLTPFLGREQELTSLGRLLAEPDCRLLTLVGPGGIGKTRLALQVASQQRGAFRDGAAFVSVAAMTSHEPIVTAIADTLGCVLYLAEDRVTQLIQYLRDREVLLVLDNYEHLLEAPDCIGLVRELLAGVPGLRLVVTSREPLDLQSEWVFEVHGLGQEAQLLFQQSARRVRAGFELRPEDWPAVAHICELVGHMPLAVELTAAWVRVLTCEEIAAEIETGFASDRALEFFATTARDVPQRHRSLSAVFEHSWQLLSEAERQALRRLAFFRSGFTREAAEQVASATLSILSALVSKSLLRRAASGRYDMHELVRQYALAQVPPDGQEAAETQQRHSDYYAALLERRGPQLKGSERTAVVTELVAELDNVRSSWSWAAEHQRAEALSRAADTLFWLYESRSNCREGVPLFNRAVTSLPAIAVMPSEAVRPAAQPQLALAQLLSYQGYFCFRQGQHALGRDLLQRSLALLRPLAAAGLPTAEAALGTTAAFLGAVSHAMGDYAEGQRLLDEGLRLKQQQNDRWGSAFCLRELGLSAYAQGKPQEAYNQLSQSLRLSREMNNSWAVSVALNYLGTAAFALGAIDEARQLQQEALALSRKLDDRFHAAYALHGLGRISQALGESAQARAYLQDSLTLSREIGDLGSVAQTLAYLGHTLLDQDEFEAAQRCFAEAIALAREAQATPIVLDAVTGEAERLARANDRAAARNLLVHILDHPAATQAVRDRARRLLERLPDSAPVADHAGDLAGPNSPSFDRLLDDLLTRGLHSVTP